MIRRDLNFQEGRYVIKLKTNASDGLIFFTSQREDGDGDFMALTLKDGFVVFSFDTGGGKVSIQSAARINDGIPHTVTFSRRFRRGAVNVDGGDPVTDDAPGQSTSVNLNRPAIIYLGGLPSSVSEIDPSLASNSLVGTILEIELEGKDVEFDTDVSSGFHVQNDPEADPCALLPCQNGATCQAVGASVTDFICTCPAGLTGPVCETPFDHCTAQRPCRHGGTCSNINTLPGFKCICPYGFGGTSCEEGKRYLYLHGVL